METRYKILGIILILTVLLFGYRTINSTYITASFTELRPFHGNIPVYYKGMKIGKARDIKLDSNYKNSLLSIQIYGRNHKIPDNTKIYLKKSVHGKIHKDYLELIPSPNPSTKFIKNGSWLVGKCTVDIEQFLRNSEPEEVEELKSNLSKASENLNMSLEGLLELLVMIQDVVAENRAGIKTSVNNLENVSKDLSNTTTKINNSVSESQLSDVISNIEKASLNLDEITGNIAETGVVGVNEIIIKTNCILDDTSCITKGLRETMSKRFGGLRLMFGKVVD